MQKQVDMYVKTFTGGMRLLILCMTIVMGNIVIVGYLDRYTQRIVCEQPGVIDGYEKGITIDKVEAYPDEEETYKATPSKKLLAVTMTVENRKDQEIVVDGLWPSVFFDEEGYQPTEAVALLEAQPNNYDLRKESTELYIPVGKKRQFTILLEVSKDVEKLYISYYEHEPYTRRYETEIPF